MDRILAWFAQLNFSSLLDGLAVIVAAVLSITVHETCHGLVAWWLGDPTAKNAGRLTLNPLKHIDLVGLVLLAVVKFGWAKPVPIDMRNFKNPKAGMAVTALAGPVSNVLLAYAALLVRSVLVFFAARNSASAPLSFFIDLTAYLAVISAGLAVFNLFPVPPLDGSKVLFAFLPQRAYRVLMRYERYGMLVMMALLLTGVLDTPLLFLRNGLLSGLQQLSAFPFDLLVKLYG
ncbi:MAG: site-2 protease family protein [Oscillospiraceae bacterium]|nr:site-2 protease family protein [Oscillospiraceae bacterium]